MPNSADQNSKDYAEGSYLSLEHFLVKAFQEIIEHSARRLIYSKEGCNTHLRDLACSELLNKILSQLAKRVYGHGRESVVLAPFSILYSLEP